MGKYLKSYKSYPAGTLVVTKKYSLWQRLKHWILKKRRVYNNLYVLPVKSGIALSKVELLINDYHLFIPIKPYTIKEMKKMDGIYPSCKTEKDFLTMLNIIRPGTVDVDKDLDQFRNNPFYKKIYLDYEPFQEIRKDDSK